MFRWFLRLALGAFLLLIIAGVVGGYFFIKTLRPVNSEALEKSQLVYVKPGTTMKAVAYDLEQRKIIKNAETFSLYSRVQGLQNKLHTGYYELNGNMSAREVLQKLVSGITYNIVVTIPEGYSIDKSLKKLPTNFLSPDTYKKLALNVNNEIKKQFPWLPDNVDKVGLEGFLYPDTYHITQTEEELIKLQLKRFEELVMPVWNNRPKNHPYNLADTVNLASIVELEGILNKELPLIAGVFLKRLKLGWKLESDPTTEYALKKHQGKKGLSFKDIKNKSPYNTYRHGGLPPGPIGNPGVEAVKAVIYPKITKNIYFVARGDGTGAHVFSSNMRDHTNAAREYYRRIRN